MAMDADAVRTLVGVIGNVISFYLFLYPLPMFFTIYKEKSVQQYKEDPYVSTIFYCAMWMLYAMPFVHPDSLLVITINGFGLVIEAIYITIFFIYSDGAKRRKMLITLAVEAIIMLIVTVITLAFLHGTKSRSAFVGILCVILSTMMYTSTLILMSTVIKTKSVKYMPLPLSLANFCNGIVWSIYALVKFDPYILIPNGLVIFSGLVQLVMYATYYKTTNWDEDDSNQPYIKLQDEDDSNQPYIKLQNPSKGLNNSRLSHGTYNISLNINVVAIKDPM